MDRWIDWFKPIIRRKNFDFCFRTLLVFPRCLGSLLAGLRVFLIWRNSAPGIVKCCSLCLNCIFGFAYIHVAFSSYFRTASDLYAWPLFLLLGFLISNALFSRLLSPQAFTILSQSFDVFHFYSIEGLPETVYKKGPASVSHSLRWSSSFLGAWTLAPEPPQRSPTLSGYDPFTRQQSVNRRSLPRVVGSQTPVDGRHWEWKKVILRRQRVIRRAVASRRSLHCSVAVNVRQSTSLTANSSASLSSGYRSSYKPYDPLRCSNGSPRKGCRPRHPRPIYDGTTSSSSSLCSAVKQRQRARPTPATTCRILRKRMRDTVMFQLKIPPAEYFNLGCLVFSLAVASTTLPHIGGVFLCNFASVYKNSAFMDAYFNRPFTAVCFEWALSFTSSMITFFFLKPFLIVLFVIKQRRRIVEALKNVAPPQLCQQIQLTTPLSDAEMWDLAENWVCLWRRALYRSDVVWNVATKILNGFAIIGVVAIAGFMRHIVRGNRILDTRTGVTLLAVSTSVMFLVMFCTSEARAYNKAEEESWKWLSNLCAASRVDTTNGEILENLLAQVTLIDSKQLQLMGFSISGFCNRLIQVIAIPTVVFFLVSSLVSEAPSMYF